MPCADHMKDEEVIARFLKARGDRCFHILHDRYAGKVFAKCLSILKNETDAKDAQQEIFLKVLLKLGSFDGRSKFSTWLYRITYNHCIDVVRRGGKVLFPEEEDIFTEITEAEVPDSVLLEIKVKVLREVLDALPAGDKLLLIMKYQDEMSIREIAGILDISESAVKMRLNRAKGRSRKYLNRHHGALAT